jgi:hypothetical protein
MHLPVFLDANGMIAIVPILILLILEMLGFHRMTVKRTAHLPLITSVN